MHCTFYKIPTIYYRRITYRIGKMKAIYLLALHTLQVFSSMPDTSYIARIINGKVRHCIRTHDCPPGNEILPCTVEFTPEECHKCPEGFVQPDYTSSSQDQKPFKCFKPRGECRARDVKDSRTPNTENCRFNRYCKCNTDMCYYGDPCTCQKRHTPCGVGETMNKFGDCVPCPDGTEKKEKGCGHCTRVLSSAEIVTTSRPSTTKVAELSSSSPAPTSDAVALQIDRRQKVTNYTDDTTSRSYTTVNEDITVQPVSEKVQQFIDKEDSNASLKTVIWILSILVVIIFTMSLGGIVLYRRRNRLKEDTENDLYEQGQLLQTQMQGDVIEEQEDNKNNIQLMRQNGIIPSESFTDSSESDSGSLNLPKDESVLASTPTSQNMEENEEENKSLISQEDDASSLQMDISKVIFEDKVISPSSPEDVNKRQKYLESKENNKEITSKSNNENEQIRDVVYITSSKLDESTLTNSQNNSSAVTGYTQVTDLCSSPVVQETDIPNNKEHQREATEHSITDSIPNHSPMSDVEREQNHQEYGHLVSASDRSTNTIMSGLEFHNFDMVETKTFSVSSQDTENKQTIIEIDMEVENNDRQS